MIRDENFPSAASIVISSSVPFLREDGEYLALLRRIKAAGQSAGPVPQAKMPERRKREFFEEASRADGVKG